MKVSFLEFLFLGGQIPPAVLAKAQLEQLRRMPSPIDIAARRGLLGPAELIQVLLRQRDHGETFAQAAKALGLWKAAIEQKIEEEYLTVRTPLVDLLREGGLVPLPELDQLWKAYEALEKIQVVAPAAADAPVPPVPATPPLLTPEPPELDPLVEEIFYEAREQLRLVGSGAPQGTTLVDSFHRLKGVLRFRGLASAERWAELGEALFRELPKAPLNALPAFAFAGEELLGAVLLGDAPDPRHEDREEAVARCLATLPAVKGEAA